MTVKKGENEMKKLDAGLEVSIEKMGQKNRSVIAWNTNKKYTKEELKAQREQFVEKAKEGHLINLSSLMITHGL